MIQIQIDQEEAMVGERVTGRVLWQPEGEVPRALTVRVGWRTEGRGSTATGTIWEQRVPSPSAPMQIPFDAAIPLDGPISYDGRLIRILWEASVQLDLPLRADPVERQRFVVWPRPVPGS